MYLFSLSLSLSLYIYIYIYMYIYIYIHIYIYISFTDILYDMQYKLSMLVVCPPCVWDTVTVVGLTAITFIADYPSEGCFSDVRGPFRTNSPKTSQTNSSYENGSHFWDI